MAIKGKKVRREPLAARKSRIRKKVRGVGERPRLTVFKSSKNIYAQVIVDQTGKTLASASTLDKEIKSELEALNAKPADDPASGEAKGGKEGKKARPVAGSLKSVRAAGLVGQLVARRSMAQNIKKVVFDRNGFPYHGRVKAVAQGARKAGLEF